jgi:hypothetical protein
VNPWAGYAPCETCGTYAAAHRGNRCQCVYAAWRALDYADSDETGQLALGVPGEQRAIDGLAAPRFISDHIAEAEDHARNWRICVDNERKP